MQIVIDIPEDVLGFVYINGFIRPEDRNTVNHAILECIELPKGHGRLIEDSFLTVTDVKIVDDEVVENTWVNYEDIENAPTIIEAEMKVDAEG